MIAISHHEVIPEISSTGGCLVAVCCVVAMRLEDMNHFELAPSDHSFTWEACMHTYGH
jgi:hypothetical protein